MKDAISTKLLVMLGLAVAVAGFGAWNLLGSDEPTGDLGFGPDSEPSVVVAPDAGGLQPIEESTTPSSRNPFERVDGPASEAGEQTDGEGGEGSEVGTDQGSTETVTTSTPPTTTPAPAPVPVFPNPNIVDDESSGGSRGDPRDDQSFEG